jgi:ABC-type bacteriocin/lantibiotic exporter with double-glycine peptidase domain
MDPFQGLADFVLGKLKQSAIALWLKFLFEILFSAIVSFLLICGVTLVSSKNGALAIGTGMITAAVVMTVVFRKETSRLTRGMFVVLPELEANKELTTDLETIVKSDKEESS